MPLPVHRPRLAEALQVSLAELDDMLADVAEVDDDQVTSTAAHMSDGDSSPHRAAMLARHRGVGAGGCWCEQTTVAWWGGRETFALRRALRLSVRAFADHIETGASTVAGWEDRRVLVSPGTTTQAALDRVLKQLEPAVRTRFWLILAGQTTISAEPVLASRRHVTHKVVR